MKLKRKAALVVLMVFLSSCASQKRKVSQIRTVTKNQIKVIEVLTQDRQKHINFESEIQSRENLQYREGQLLEALSALKKSNESILLSLGSVKRGGESE